MAILYKIRAIPCPICGGHKFHNNGTCLLCNVRKNARKRREGNPIRNLAIELRQQGLSSAQIIAHIRENDIRNAKGNPPKSDSLSKILHELPEYIAPKKPSTPQWSHTKWFKVMGDPKTTPRLFFDDVKAINDFGSGGRTFYSNRSSLPVYGAVGGEII